MPDQYSALTCSPGTISLAQTLASILGLLLLHLPLIYLCRNMARAFLPEGRTIPRLAAGLVLYFFFISLSAWVCPGSSYPWLLAWSLLLGAAGFFLGRDLPPAEGKENGPGASFTSVAGTAAVTLFLLVLLVYGLLRPSYDHDALTYQLHFAAVWLHSGHVSIVPTPFGDPAQAYGPGLASIYYMWLMAPLGNDLLAATGAWPFFVLAVLAAAGLARELGCREGFSWSAPMFAFMAPFLVHQAGSPLSDVAVAAFFACSLYFFSKAVRTMRPVYLFFGLVSAGMMTGGKYTGLPLLFLLAIPAVLCALVVRGRGTALAWLTGAGGGLAGGGGWYFRNLFVTGNPVFPIKFSLFGLELFPGLYGREQMEGWIFHREGARAWLEIMGSNAPVTLWVLGVLAMGVIFYRGLRGRGNEDRYGADKAAGILIAYMALVPFLVDRMNWGLLPFQQERFWVPAVPVLAAVMAAAFSRNATALIICLLVCYAGLFSFMPELSHLPASALSLIKSAFPACAAAGVLWGLFLHVRPGTGRLRGLVSGAGRGLPAFGLGAALVFVLVLFGLPGHLHRRAASLERLYPLASAWRALPCPSDGVTVAYTGTNVPYPLHGPGLNNRVVYLSTSGEVMPKDHEIMRRMESGPPKFATPEPELTRLRHCPAEWGASLILNRIKYLFVTRVGRNALLNVAHDNKGWPVEERWASAAPSLFRLVYEGRAARIYKVAGDMEDAASLPEDCEQRPPDALEASWRSPGLARRFFPLAGRAIEEMGLR